MEAPRNLTRMQIAHLIKFAESFRGIEVHLFLNSKYVKLNYSEDQFIEILRKLQQKDVKEVFLHAEDCRKIMNRVRESMSAQTFYDPKPLMNKE